MKTLILTNGAYGNYDFCKVTGFDYIICADRGMLHARKLGITPDLIVGDFDSTEPEDLTYFKEQGVQIESFSPQKDVTDTELAISYALSKGATHITIYGGLGSRFDHSLANVQLLYALLKLQVEGCLVSENHVVYLIDKALSFEGQKDELVSLIPFAGDVEGVTTTGLAYPLDHSTVPMGTGLGISNYMVEEKASITIESGYLLVIRAKDI